MFNKNQQLGKLREREAKIKKQIAAIQSREKSEERRQRTARLIKLGIVVEAMLKSGELDAEKWILTCRSKLNERDFELATAKIRSSAKADAHLPVSPAEKQCAPAAGENLNPESGDI